MDPRVRKILGSQCGIQLGKQSVPLFSDQNLVNGPRFEKIFPNQKTVNETRVENTYLNQNMGGIQFHQNDPSRSYTFPSSSVSGEEEAPEDYDFSDEVLRYVSKMLMEEDMEEKTCMLQESLDFQAAEKSFYEVLGKKYPPSPEPVHHPSFVDQYSDSPDNYLSEYYNNFASSSSDNSGYLMDPSWIDNNLDYNTAQVRNFPTHNASHLSINSSDSLDSIQIRDLHNESQSIWQFQKGVEEANKFLPVGNGLLFDWNVNGDLCQDPKVGNSQLAVKVEIKDKGAYSPNESRGRKNLHREEVDLEDRRSNKQAAVYQESTLRSEEFDLVLLASKGDGMIALSSLRETLRNGMSKNTQQNGQSKGFTAGKGRKKQSRKKEVIDLRTLLVNCAQAVAADDRTSANDLLRQIRLHSSPFGDGSQRLAHCFADGLEARLAGTGSQIHKALVNKRASAADYLKAYQLYIASCPFRKISHFASNRTIMDTSKNAMRVHIIDFGILYGFQWPTLIQRIAERTGGPPKLRITGIEFPQTGFRPAERIEETGRRLAAYAQEYKVPFEYNALAKKWESVTIEDLKIDKDEFLVVNCLYRSKNLLDETVMVESPRTAVLNLIRKINPNIFLHGIVNGAYGAPFFVTRFREALFHFSAMFDMLEAVVPREYSERMLLEREVFGREALNVIACEGWERVEKPETYKQWHVRNLRAGFMQTSFDREFINRAREKVRLSYHKDFVIDEDSKWLVQGWKGRIMFAISCWKPV